MDWPIEVALRDGSSVLVRQAHARDADRLREGFAGLSEESRYRRFLAPTPRLSNASVRYFTAVDHVDHEALIALEPGTGRGVATARFVRCEPGGDVAEAAVTVADAWQGRGLGGELLELLRDRALAEGVRCFVASVLDDNRASLGALAHAGDLRVTGLSAGVLDVEIDLRPGEALRGVLREAAAAT